MHASLLPCSKRELLLCHGLMRISFEGYPCQCSLSSSCAAIWILAVRLFCRQASQLMHYAGNYFFAGARTFFRSLESAVFLFSRVARIPEGSTVLPAICTEDIITLGAELEDGTVIKGQNNISHPDSDHSNMGGEETGPSAVDKSDQYQSLSSPIRRVFYLSREGTGQEHEVSPPPNPHVLLDIQRADAVVYGMGSLFTSICPTLILDGVGEAIAVRSDIPKLLLLNGSHDRETATCGCHDGPMHASDVVQAITDALNRRNCRQGTSLKHPPSAYVTTLVVPYDGAIEVDEAALELLGVSQVVEVASVADADGRVLFDAEELVQTIGHALYGTGLLPCVVNGISHGNSIGVSNGSSNGNNGSIGGSSNAINIS
eukprot:GHRR01023978.1.p1 GENE.GHRR01023978.1~~GHRR01023978.1.p1  ORF type:complete len:373 (+),score=108.01 GHRR01023978.1:159-1277(+)